MLATQSHVCRQISKEPSANPPRWQDGSEEMSEEEVQDRVVQADPEENSQGAAEAPGDQVVQDLDGEAAPVEDPDALVTQFHFRGTSKWSIYKVREAWWVVVPGKEALRRLLYDTIPEREGVIDYSMKHHYPSFKKMGSPLPPPVKAHVLKENGLTQKAMGRSPGGFKGVSSTQLVEFFKQFSFVTAVRLQAGFNSLSETFQPRAVYQKGAFSRFGIFEEAVAKESAEPAPPPVPHRLPLDDVFRKPEGKLRMSLSAFRCWACIVANRACTGRRFCASGGGFACDQCECQGLLRRQCAVPTAVARHVHSAGQKLPVMAAADAVKGCHICKALQLSAGSILCVGCNKRWVCTQKECRDKARVPDGATWWYCCHCLGAPLQCGCDENLEAIPEFVLTLKMPTQVPDPLLAFSGKPHSMVPEEIRKVRHFTVQDNRVAQPLKVQPAPEHQWLDNAAIVRGWTPSEHKVLGEQLSGLRLRVRLLSDEGTGNDLVWDWLRNSKIWPMDILMAYLVRIDEDNGHSEGRYEAIGHLSTRGAGTPSPVEVRMGWPSLEAMGVEHEMKPMKGDERGVLVTKKKEKELQAGKVRCVPPLQVAEFTRKGIMVPIPMGRSGQAIRGRPTRKMFEARQAREAPRAQAQLAIVQDKSEFQKADRGARLQARSTKKQSIASGDVVPLLEAEEQSHHGSIVDEGDKKGSKRKVAEQAEADDVQESSDEVPAGQESPDEVSARRKERQEKRDARATPQQSGALHPSALASQAAPEETLGRAKEKKQQRKKVAEAQQQQQPQQQQQQQQQGKKAADPGQSGTLHPSQAAKPSPLEAASERESTERQERKKAEEQTQSGASQAKTRSSRSALVEELEKGRRETLERKERGETPRQSAAFSLADEKPYPHEVARRTEKQERRKAAETQQQQQQSGALRPSGLASALEKAKTTVQKEAEALEKERQAHFQEKCAEAEAQRQQRQQQQQHQKEKEEALQRAKQKIQSNLN
ncbi:unnamed protein product, partial [Polarella glacialis]